MLVLGGGAVSYERGTPVSGGIYCPLTILRVCPRGGRLGASAALETPASGE